MSDMGLESANQSTTETEPQSTVGEGSGQPTSPDIAAFVKRLEALEAKQRTEQSQKDRGVARVEKKLNEFQPVMELVQSLLKQGVTDPDQITREVEYQEIRRRVLGQEEQQAAPETRATGNGEDTLGEDAMVQQVATGLKLDINDPEVVSILRAHTGAEAVASLATLSMKRAQAPQPSPSTTPAIKAGVAQSDAEKTAAAEKQLAELQKNPTVNKAEIKKLKAQLGWS